MPCFYIPVGTSFSHHFVVEQHSHGGRHAIVILSALYCFEKQNKEHCSQNQTESDKHVENFHRAVVQWLERLMQNRVRFLSVE